MTRVLRIATRANRGGPTRQWAALMPRLARLGFEGPLAVGPASVEEGDASEALEALGIEVLRVASLRRRPAPLADLRAYRDLLRLARTQRPELVHTHMAKGGALGRRVARALGIPAVHTFHGHHFGRPGAGARAITWAERRLAPATAAWIALTDSQRDDIVTALGEKVAARVHVIGPGLDVDALRAQAAAIPLPPRGPHFEFVWLGRHVPVKRPSWLVRAFLDAVAHSPPSARPLRLTLCGEGPLREEVATLCRQHPAGAQVQLVGLVEDPVPYLARADAVVNASSSEGTPLGLLEGMALAKPVVATRVGGVAEIITHGEHGILVGAQDARGFSRALLALAGDPGRAAAQGAAAAEHVKRHFGAQRLARDTAALYEAVLTHFPV